MYSYSYDVETGGILLNSSPLLFSKEPRPVYYKELDILGLDKYWNYEKNDSYPYMWAEANNYFYRGRKVAQTKGGSCYTAPEITILEEPEPNEQPLRFVDVPAMVARNQELLEGLVQETIKKVYNTYQQYQSKVDVFYVAFSGGKDSVVALDIVQRALPHGIVDTNTLQEALVNKVALVSVMYANNEIGSLEPIHELCNIAHRNGAKFHTDAVQAVGHVKIDVKEIGVDMMSASAHKFNGPKGIGFLYVKTGTALKPFADGGAQEYGMRAGTENVAGIVAMSVALKKACSHIDDRRKHLLKLEDLLLQGLKKYNTDFIRNGSSNRVPGNISLSFKNANGEMLLHRLDLMGIMVSTGSACDSTNTQMSHVLKAIKIPEEYGFGTIRISFNHENTEEDAKYIAESIGKILTTVTKAKLKRS